jgi:hypothetical protein
MGLCEVTDERMGLCEVTDERMGLCEVTDERMGLCEETDERMRLYEETDVRMELFMKIATSFFFIMIVHYDGPFANPNACHDQTVHRCHEGRS